MIFSHLSLIADATAEKLLENAAKSRNKRDVRQKNKLEEFSRKMLEKIGKKAFSVEVIALTNSNDSNKLNRDVAWVDVYYVVHKDLKEYIPLSSLNGLVNMHKNEFSKVLGSEILISPVDACSENYHKKNYGKTYNENNNCFSQIKIFKDSPQLHNTNTTSLVTLHIDTMAQTSRGRSCDEAPCLNGGTCFTDEEGQVICHCIGDFKGAWCQSSKVTFRGHDSFLWVSTQAHPSHISFHLTTLKENGLVMYQGGMDENNLKMVERSLIEQSDNHLRHHHRYHTLLLDRTKRKSRKSKNLRTKRSSIEFHKSFYENTRKYRRKRTRHFVKNAEKTSQKSSYMSPSPSQDEDKNIFDDFIFLYLKGGHPVLVVGKNSVIRRVAISGVNSRGAMQVNDGSWHQLDVLITEEEVRLVVDRCDGLVEVFESDVVSFADTAACEGSAQVPAGPMRLGGVLSLGGVHPGMKKNAWMSQDSFIGCIKDVFYDSQLIDLHIESLGVKSGVEMGCKQENHNCNNIDFKDNRRNSFLNKACGEHGQCVSGLLVGSAVGCVCEAGWKGQWCEEEATVIDFGPDTFIEWDFSDEHYWKLDRGDGWSEDWVLSLRTREREGGLVVAHNTLMIEYCTIEIVDWRIQYRHNIGMEERSIQLTRVNISDGLWHQVRVKRRGSWLELKVDHGEGDHSNTTFNKNPKLHVSFKVKQRSLFLGASVKWVSFNREAIVHNSFRNGCLRDVRHNNHLLPMSFHENNNVAIVTNRSEGLKEGCHSDSCGYGSVYYYEDDAYEYVGDEQEKRGKKSLARSDGGRRGEEVCDNGLECVDGWRVALCRCPEGSRERLIQESDGNTTKRRVCDGIDECLELSPCVHGSCEDLQQGYQCECNEGWDGVNCTIPTTTSFFPVSPELVLAVVVSFFIITALIFVVIIVLRNRSKSYNGDHGHTDDLRDTSQDCANNDFEQQKCPLKMHDFDFENSLNKEKSYRTTGREVFKLNITEKVPPHTTFCHTIPHTSLCPASFTPSHSIPQKHDPIPHNPKLIPHLPNPTPHLTNLTTHSTPCNNQTRFCQTLLNAQKPIFTPKTSTNNKSKTKVDPSLRQHTVLCSSHLNLPPIKPILKDFKKDPKQTDLDDDVMMRSLIDRCLREVDGEGGVVKLDQLRGFACEGNGSCSGSLSTICDEEDWDYNNNVETCRIVTKASEATKLHATLSANHGKVV